MATIQVPVTFDRAARRKDKSVGFGLSSTLEVSTEDFSEMDRLIGQSGWLLFRPNDNAFDEVDVPTTNAPSEGKKPSSRLRAVMFIYWKDCTDQATPFDDFYANRMEKIITQYKALLPERDV